MATFPIFGPDWLDKQLSMPSSKSFLRVDFRLVMNYLLLKRNEEKIGLTVDVAELEDFSELIEAAFNATCEEQHLEFLRKCDKHECYKNQLTAKNTQRRREKCSPTIIKWALMEAAKYCLQHKLTRDENATRQFLTLLKNEIASSFHHSDRSNRQHLIVFLWYLERLWSQSSSQFLIESWFDRNRRLIARLCLIVDRPHDSWRHMNLKLLTDLAIRYSTREESQLLVESVSKISMSRAIQSLNTDEWKSNLRLIALSARQIGDDDLIYGLESLTRNSGIVNKNWQAINLIKSNNDRNFEETYRMFLESFKKSSNFASELIQTLDQSDLVEFLDACIELERLTQHTEVLDLLKSKDHKSLYKLCADSIGINQIDDLYEVHDAVKDWVSTWTLEPGCDASNIVQPASSLLSLAEVVLENLQSCSSTDEDKFMMAFRTRRRFMIEDSAFDAVKIDLERQGLRILHRGPMTKRITPTHPDEEYKEAHRVTLKNMLSSKEELYQLAKQYLISDQAEDADLPEDDPWNGFNVRVCEFESGDETAITIALISKTLNNQYQAQQQVTTQVDCDLLNTSFNYDIQLLLLSTKDGYASVMYPIAETAAILLDKIKNHASLLSESNLRLFKRSLKPHVITTWSKLKDNLVSLATSSLDIPKVWMDAITDVIHAIAVAQPNVLLYECVVSRLDLQCQLAGYGGQMSERSDKFADDSLLLHCHDQQQKPRQRDEHIRLLKFWEGVYLHILEKGGENMSDWSYIVAQTETFLREIRKISYLPGEYFKALTMRLNRRLNQFFNMFKKHADPRDGQIKSQKYLDECRARLNEIYKQDGKSISILRIYFERMIGRKDRTVYESNLGAGMTAALKELEYRFRLLVSKKVLVSLELERLLRSITTLISFCHTKVTQVHHAFKQKLYLESISPFLSRLKSGSVIMPEYIDSDTTCSPGSIYYSEGNNQRSNITTIHKINQNVQMIHSKTAPKKISFVGSDGVTRSYLLKAHEDLRLDRLLMELSGAINSVLAHREDTAKYGYSLKRYSVTPVSNRSGLIQWVEAPSLHTFYKTWFDSSEGQCTLKGLYKQTCQLLCANPESDNSKDHTCAVKTVNQTTHPFYQLLWAQIKKRDVRADTNAIKPRVDNTLRYRQELPNDVYEDVVEQLLSNIPQDLLANQLWTTSRDSKSYYISTRNFIRSCAAHSIFGYIVGLGDRHPDNILLELESGRVTHIDHTICFDAGRDLFIPERVPFRLTQSMVRAFGFAGLEGGFTLSCQRILLALRESRNTILNHLDPINLKFMIDQDASTSSTSGATLEQAPQQGLPKRTKSDLSVRVQRFSPSLMKQSEEEGESSSGGWHYPANNPPRVNAGDNWSDDSWAPGNNSRRASDDDGWSASVPSEPRGHDDGWDRAPSQPRLPRVRLQVHDIEEVSEETMFLPQVLPPDDDIPFAKPPADLQPIDDFQINIKTPKKITSKHADDIQKRIRDKLTGHDEQLRSKILASASSSSTTSQRRDPAKPGQDLISLDEEALSIEDQVNCLITEALSNKNKAAMFEGWSPWV